MKESKMCGILALINYDITPLTRMHALQKSNMQAHRGPDSNGILEFNGGYILHERLGIVAPYGSFGNRNVGDQPLRSTCGRVFLVANAEIYNHNDNKTNLLAASDCESILQVYLSHGETDDTFPKYLDGIFAAVIVDLRHKDPKVVVFRDHIGVNPLYYTETIIPDQHHTIQVASEMKCLSLDHASSSLMQFPPGCVMSFSLRRDTNGLRIFRDKRTTRWYTPKWLSIERTICPSSDDCNSFTAMKTLQTDIRTLLIQAVRRQMKCDVNFGVLLSGGLDSSLIASIAAKEYVSSRRKGDPSTLRTFSVGFSEDSPDLEYATTVSKFIGSTHTNFIFSKQDGIDAIRQVIWHTESYDVTTIRASIPLYLMSRRIKSLGIKMVLSGEGADEIFGGYLYFHKCPNYKEFQDETRRKVTQLHKHDCLRCNKATMAWGVEARVPFLDRTLVDYVMDSHPAFRFCRNERGDSRIEKYLLRSAFDVDSKVGGNLPREVLYRQKDQFSDAVCYTWIPALKAEAELRISNARMENAHKEFNINTPHTKEALMYRSIFTELFPLSQHADTVAWGPSVACSSPAVMSWDASFAQINDQSGLAVSDVHNHVLKDGKSGQ